MLSDLTRQAKSCWSQCNEMLKDSISLKVVCSRYKYLSIKDIVNETYFKNYIYFYFYFFVQNVELFLKEWDAFTVNIQELNLLKQYYSDAISWVSRVNHVLVNVHEREDQENVVDELTQIHGDGLSMKIQGKHTYSLCSFLIIKVFST